MKIPFFDIYIIKGRMLRRTEKKIKGLEALVEEQLKKIILDAKITARQLHQLAVLHGRIKAPECPRCGRPKTAGGIQWLDHPIGCHKQKEHNAHKEQKAKAI